MAFFRPGVKGRVPDSRLITPSSRNFRIYKYCSIKTKKKKKVLKCDFEHCNKHFSKFHNFYDHLRKHTGERPFECPFKQINGCPKKFTQKANLDIHVAKHNEKVLQCSHSKTASQTE